MKAKALSTILIYVSMLFVQGLSLEVTLKNSTTNSNRRVLSGDITDPADFPYLIRLHKGNSLCGGTIISNYFILTASHCIANYECSTIEIFPSTFMEGQKPRIHAVQCVTHEKYVPTRNFYYDIALLKTLEDLLDDGDLQAILLPAPGTHYPSGVPALVVGWGKVDTTYPGRLLRADVYVEDWHTCNYEYKHAEIACVSDIECPVSDIPKRSICTLSESSNPSGTCFGDSGGPMLIDGVVAGVIVGVIIDDHGCVIGTPSLGSNVADYLSWIYSIIDPDLDTSQYPVVEEQAPEAKILK